MNIAMVSEHASPLATVGGIDAGGQNVHVAELARALAGRGHRLTVYTRQDAPDASRQVWMSSGVQVVHVPAGPPQQVGKDDLLPYMPEFSRFLRAEWAARPPDVVHAHFWMSGFAALRAGRAAGVPVVQTFHALGVVKRRYQREADTSPPERIPIEAAVGRGAALVVATATDEVAELIELGVPRAAVTVIPCGVDVDSFSPDGPAARRGSRRRLIAVGRLVPRKGFDLAIQALRMVPDTELVIVGGPAPAELGTDAEAGRLRALAERCGVADRVRLTGRVARSGLPPLLRSADIAVCTPRYEPFGMTALAAMACGVPVVATAVGGLTDTVINGVSGELVSSPGPSRLAGVLRSLLADPFRLGAYRAGGLDRARARYSWSRIAADTEAAYRRARGAQPLDVVAAPASDLGGTPAEDWAGNAAGGWTEPVEATP
jgi:glycosyltransferase involved in cell wall biosynthesis